MSDFIRNTSSINQVIGINNNRKLFFYIFIFSLIVHLGLLFVYGQNASKDFQRVYEPAAIQLLQGGDGTGEVSLETGHSKYYFFRLGYVLFISSVYYVFGIGNRTALILVQIILSCAMFAQISLILVKNYHSRVIAIIFTCIAFLTFDNIALTLVCTPATLFRVMFMWAYFTLLSLYFKNKTTKFIITTFCSLVLLFFIRIDVLVLYIPIYVLFIKIIIDDVRNKKMLNLFLVLLSFLFAIIFLGNFMPEISAVKDTLVKHVVRGSVIVQYTHIEVFDYTRSHDVIYIIARCAKLFALRVYQYMNVLPPLWNKWHKLYYAIHMFPFYLLTCVGIIRCWKTRDLYFGMFFFVYLSSILLHGLTRVDAALRTSFSTRLFLVICAGYGFDYIYRKYKSKYSGSKL